VIISLGTNDSFEPQFNVQEFERQVHSFIFKVRQHITNAAILLTVPPDSFKRKRKNSNIPIIRRIFREDCKNQNVALWDLYMVMGCSNSIAVWKSNKLALNDYVNFNSAGYSLQAGFLVEVLLVAYDQYAHKKAKFCSEEHPEEPFEGPHGCFMPVPAPFPDVHLN
jgi:lysophospholipase L1-like esterase